MKARLTAVLSMWLILPAVADDNPNPPAPDFSTVAPENDSRLAKLKDAQPQKIGILTYYPNKGGGYTFMEGKQVALVALPYLPTTSAFNAAMIVSAKGERRFVGPVTIVNIGTLKMPFGGQTLYRSQMTRKEPGFLVREDIPIATLARDTPSGQFRLSTLAEDSETRMKLKSIVPVLEHASKPLPSKP